MHRCDASICGRARGFRWLQNIALRIAALGSIGLFLGLGQSAMAANAPPMTAPGQFNVGATGAANYSIPISVPPGTAGMVPALSLAYSSQSGDGIAGLGWMLSGLSSIDHCPRTLAQDNTHGGVNYDANDRYCLNGQRLVATSGAYGANNTEYHTEIDSFAKIVSYGTAGNGPQYFKVWTKSGQVMELGYATDSRILAVGKTTARTWALDKFTDVKGNYYTVTYTNDTTNGQYYPTRIDYTGNASAGLATYNSVQFAYTTRSDIVPTYQAGSLNQTTVLLTHVKTYQGTNLVYDYRLAYNSATSAASHDELNSVTQCDGSSVCLAPTTFGWQGSRDQLTVTSAANGLAQGYGLTYGDFNADGLTDALVLRYDCPSSGVIYSGSQTGTFSAASITAQYDYFGNNSNGTHTTYSYNGNCILIHGAVVADVDGDGFTDIVNQIEMDKWQKIPGRWVVAYTAEVLRNNHSGQLTQISADGAFAWPFVFGPPAFPSDFNGDGRADGYLQGTAGGNAYFSNGDGTFTADAGESNLGTSSTLTTGDFDGDGCTDFLAQGATNAIVYFCNPATSQATVSSWTSSQVVLGDYNGDGKTDILVVNSSGATLYLSTGTGLSSGYAIPSSSSWYYYNVRKGDWNGDGKDDIILSSGTSGQPHLIFLSTGTGFFQAASIANSDTYANAVVADWNNDGAQDIWLQKTSGDTLYTFSYVPELMTSVSNGIGATTTITYDRLNKNGSFYTKGSGAAYPTKDADGPFYVVSRIDTSNGIGGTVSSTYAYAGLKQDLHGLGSLGFSSIAATNVQTGIITMSNYRQDFPYIGAVSSQTTTSGSVTLSSTANTYANTNEGAGTDGVTRYSVYLSQSVISGHDLDGTTLPTTTAAYTWDAYGNVLTQTVSVSDGSSRTTTNTYTNDTTNWRLGQVLTTNVQSIVGSSNITRHLSFTHDFSTGLITEQVIEPGDTPHQVTTDYTYDAYGNITQTTVSGSGIMTRSTSAGYDLLGEFQTSATNALSQSESWTYMSAQSLAFGEPTSHTGLNGLTTSWTYDTFGRPTLETRPDGDKTATSYTYCSGVNGGSASCVTYGAFIATATPQNSSGTQNGPQSIAYYDSHSRGIAGDAQGFSGAWVRQATNYDSWGRVSQTSRPYFVSGGTAKWTVYTDDILGRPTHVALPNGGYANYAYHGLSVTVTNDKGQSNTTVSNAQGLTASVTDAASHATSYVYDAFGDATSVTDPSSNAITNTFDIRGNKTASSDPDMGSWSYGYDVLGELTSQTDAKSQSTTLAYDVMGRVASRTETGLYSAWTYGTTAASHNIGKPIEAKACTTSGCSTVVADRTFTYDSLGRPLTGTLAVDGTNYTYTDGYDSNNRLSTLTYPSGFAALYAYTSLGYLSQIKDNGSGSTYWTANTRDAELHLLTQTFGNGINQTNTYDANTGFLTNVRAGPSNNVAQFDYTYDTVGNLNYRSDNYNGVFEYACYDTLNRLTNYAAGTGVTACTSSGTKTVGYDALGDITSKTGVGTYAYGAGVAGPHAVSSIAGTVNGVVNPAYTYDANNNMTAGAGRTVTYTSFNMAASIVQGSTTVSLSYDSEHTRVKMTAPSGTTYYLNDPATGAMSEKLVSGSTTTWHDYIAAPGDGLVAEKFSGGTTAIRYITLDHLGSIAVVTNESGAVVERDAYDAWGKRRNINGSDDTTCSLTSLTTRGFTGHEHIDGDCLINANARIYDPTIARFMSADDEIPDAFNGQAFNRFSYVNNGPLSFIDPTGHENVETVTVTGTGQSWHIELRGSAMDLQQFENRIALGDPTRAATQDDANETVWVTGVKKPSATQLQIYASLGLSSDAIETVTVIGTRDRTAPPIAGLDPNGGGYAQLATDWMSGALQTRMVTSGAGRAFIQGLEQYVDKIYPDQAGNSTFGWGHKLTASDEWLAGALPTMGEDEKQFLANAMFDADVDAAEIRVNSALGGSVNSLSQNQFDALVAASFNGGLGPNMVADIRGGDFATAATEFNADYIHQGGQLVFSQGLANRNAAEQNLFVNGQY